MISINRNIVECKSYSNIIHSISPPSINRNIVECKYTSVWHVSGNAVVLIETLWNVNYYHPFADPHCIIVLIETLWNVNLEPITFPVLSLFVLIETLWNVNLNRRYGISKHALY